MPRPLSVSKGTEERRYVSAPQDVTSFGTQVPTTEDQV